MENCTIYSHKLAFDKVIEIVKNHLPKAKVEVNDGGLQKSLVAKIKGGFFSNSKELKINYRERKNPSYRLENIECGLTQNLAGMVSFIQEMPCRNEAVKNKFLIKVMSANCEMSFMADPEIKKDFEPVLRAIVTELNGYVFAQPSRMFQKSDTQHFLDQDLNLIIDQKGGCEIEDIDVTVDAKYHDISPVEYTKEQIDRKERSEKFLTVNNIKMNKNLPCLVSSEDVDIRSKEAIVNRAYSLLVMAVKGEGLPLEHIGRLVVDKEITSFSPKEEFIYNSPTLSDQEKAYATWRYESLYTVLWALGKMDELKYPSDICNVQEVVGQLFKPSRKEFEDSVNLRSTAEILDELDRTYRMNWACVDARIKGESVSGNINPSVIYERHYALNWLSNYQNQDWDDVQTNT